jgi:SMODS-associated and fused to various effectors sensor domain
MPNPKAQAKNEMAEPSSSPVLKGRGIPCGTQAMLYAVAAGRCEFRGCNKFLLQHHLTLKDGNFAQMAHIYAFSQAGPRGDARKRPDNPHGLANLMLLCPECHKQVDVAPTDFPVDLLKEYKCEHEDRIRHVGALRQDHRTVVLQLKSKIGGEAVEIPLTDVSRSVAPRWPMDRHGIVIDLTKIDDTHDRFTELAAAEIRKKVDRLYEPGMEVDQVRHISLFALAPMPLLMYLGHCLSNKISVELHQRHRDTKDWLWKADGLPVEYDERLLRQGTDPSRVALVLSLSGTIGLARLPANVDATFTVFELTLADRNPNPDFLRRRDDLVAFATIYRRMFSNIEQVCPSATEVHLFPAVPAPVAVACGHEILKKTQPTLIVYDYDKAKGGFTEAMRIGRDDARTAM